MKSTLFRISLATTMTLFLAAEANSQQRPDFSKVEIKTTQLADNFYTLEGQGGAISVLTGPEGVLLVDSQFAPLTDKLLEAINQLESIP